MEINEIKDKKYTEISNTATKLNTEYNNLTSNYSTKEATNKRPRTDMQSLSKLLAKFDRKQVSNLSLEGVMKQLNGTEEQILYIRELHRLHNIKYS